MNRINFIFVFSYLIAGCSASITEGLVDTTAPAETTTAETALSARIIFHENNFRNLRDLWPTGSSTVYNCLGDVLKVYKTSGDSFNGTPTAFPTTSTDAFAPTEKPAFLKNVSVDITRPYHNHINAGDFLSDGCSYRAILTEYVDYCADFDDPTAVLLSDAAIPPTVARPGTLNVNPTPTPIMGLPADGGTYTDAYAFGAPGDWTGYYRARDYYCIGQGTISDPSIELTKAYVGGVDVDIDRSQLGAHENLLMVLTYHSMGSEYSDTASKPLPFSPAAGTVPFFEPEDDETVLRVKLQSTGMTYAQLISALQPRSRFYNAAPITTVLPDLATFRDPYRGLRSEFIEIPLSADSTIDRIRVERVRGSFILYQMDLYRMGNRS